MVVGDGMADWLAYGLEDAFAEKPEFAVLRKNRTASGLIRYDPRRDVEWPQVVKEIISANKPKFIVMMIGINDRQQIRDRAAPAPAAPNAAARPSAPTKPSPRLDPGPADPELQAPQSADQRNAGQEESPEPPPAGDQRGIQAAAGTFEFHTDKWEAAYVRRIDATVAALKSASVPVFWVGLPAQRNSRGSSDSAYLNELYRQAAEKAGIVYVDVWDGFVDDAGGFASQGPDFEGQIRRLRSGDGVYFTRAGARKLAHYVEREILRAIATGAAPVALPLEPAQAAPGGRPGSSGGRPLAGPVIPLTVSTGGGDELLGSARGERASPGVPLAAPVLTRGESLAPPTGRADDFNWPRPSEAADTGQSPLPPTAEVQRSAGPLAKGQTQAGAGAVAVPNGAPATAPARARRSRSNPPPTDAAPHPPMPIRPSAERSPTFVP